MRFCRSSRTPSELTRNKQHIRRGFEKHISLVHKNQLRIVEGQEGIARSRTNKANAAATVRRCMRELTEMRAAAVKILDAMFKAKFSVGLPSAG